MVPKSGKKNKKNDDPVEKIVSRLKKKELGKLVLYLARREEEVRAHILTKYADRLPQTSRKDFAQLVKSVINAHRSDRYGFIDYRSSSRLGDQLYKLVEEASGEWPTVYVCEEVIDQGATACQEADDSSGSIGGAIESAFNRLYDLVQPESAASSKVPEYLFDLAIVKHAEAKYDGFDWGGNFRHLAALAIHNKEQAKQLMQVLDHYIAGRQKEKYGGFYVEQAAILKLGLLEKWDSPEAARAYLLEHLHFSGFRRRELENAMREKRYADVRRLAEEGIVFDTDNRYPGLVNEWKKWLMRWADAIGDKTALIELTEKMYLESGNLEYYRQLKKMIPKKEFATRVEDYIGQFKKGFKVYPGSFDNRIAAVLEEEGRLLELMAMIEVSPRLDLLDHYQKLLAKGYPKQYIECYDRAVRQKMEHAGSRQIYRECCQYLKLMIKIGGKEQVRQTIADWRVAYPKRRAMLEELTQVKM